jgi:hypothetical protein
VDYYGQLTWFGNNVVFDLNETGDLAFTAAPLRGTQFGVDPTWQIALSTDAGTVCFANNQCSVRYSGIDIGIVNGPLGS